MNIRRVPLYELKILQYIVHIKIKKILNITSIGIDNLMEQNPNY